MKGARCFAMRNWIARGFRIIGVVMLGAQAAVSLQLDAAEVLQDINPSAHALGSYIPYPRDNASIGSVTVFAMDDGKHGTELWRTDGTAAGTYLVKDIFAGATASLPAGFTLLGNRAVFSADDGVNGREYWITDGTSAGTRIIANINGTSLPSASMPLTARLPVLNGTVLFAATDDRGTELWRSDGTREGTWLIRDIYVGSGSSEPRDFVRLGNIIFFSAESATHGRELWVTDGQPSGTRQLPDIAPGAADANPAELTAADSFVYFRAEDGSTGPELWRANSSGATLVADAVPGANGSMPRNLIALGDVVIYSGIDGLGVPVGSFPIGMGEPFRSDGTGAGTYPLADVYPGTFGSSPTSMTKVGSRIVFRIENAPANVSSIWGTDGTVAGTQPLVAAQAFDFYNYRVFFEYGSELLFHARLGAPGQYGAEPNLWRTDGTALGTRVFAQLPQPANPTDDLAVMNGRVYYAASEHYGNAELWSSDGTVAGTRVLVDADNSIGTSPDSLFAANNRVYFLANDGVHGAEPWVTDGNAAGTRMLGDFNVSILGEGSNPERFATLSSSLSLFIANDGAHGRELWVTDGTVNGTRILRDIAPGSAWSSPSYPVVIGGIAYFQATDETGTELWRSNGTTVGTYRVADIYPGSVPNTCDPRNQYCPPPNPNPPPASSEPMQNAMAFNGVLYFAADDGVHGRELWRSNGTAGGTSLVMDLTSGADSTGLLFMSVVGNQFFLCVAEGVVWRLWISDGTAQGTLRVTEAVDCNPSGSVQSAAYQGALYFSGRTLDNDVELWRSDGTSAGTYRVLQLGTGDIPSYPSRLRAVGNALTFSAHMYAQQDYGFYISDGTAQGTVKALSGIDVGSGIEAGGLWYFVASNLSSPPQYELFVTDGTLAGTRSASQSGASLYNYFGSDTVLYNGHFIFTSDGSEYGPAVWLSSTGTSAARMLFDPTPGIESHITPGGYFTAGNSLLFAADDGIAGNELWIVPNGAPTANRDEASGVAGAAVSITVLGNDGFFGIALSASSVTIATPPRYGIATVNVSTGAVSYTPSGSFSGLDEFYYRVSDTTGRQSNVAKVSVLITAPSGATPGVAPNEPLPPIPPIAPTPTPTPTPLSSSPTSNEGSGGGGEFSLLLLMLLAAVLRIQFRLRGGLS
jgi:ELWxxDGT repeat protein